MSDRAKAKAAAVVRSLPSIRTRRHRVGTAAAAYSHALKMTENAAVAAQIAVTALKRGAQSRTAVLAHARHLSLQSAVQIEMDKTAISASPELKTLAQQLAATRPAIERAIVDLELRYGLDQETFARSLGLTLQRAAIRSSEVSEQWAAELDPAMMAALGAGACPEMQLILAEHQIGPVIAQEHTPPFGTPAIQANGEPAGGALPQASATIGQLIELSANLSDHAISCETCGNRLKRLTSVRSLFGNQPPEDVPPLVATAARSGRRRLPAPLPPSIEPKRLDLYRLKNVAASIVLALLAGLILIGGYSVVAGGEDSQSDRVQRLIEEGPAVSLLATPSVIGPNTTTASISNTSDKQVSWNATSNVQWIVVQPASGSMGPNERVNLRVNINQVSARTDGNRGTVTIVADDGSRQTIQFRDNG